VGESGRRRPSGARNASGRETKRPTVVLSEVVVPGDGAPRNRHLAAEHFGTRSEILDFSRASEHVWTAARALHGEGTPATTAWAQSRIEELPRTGAAPVLVALVEATAPTPEAVEILRRERGYVRTNAERMAYPSIRERGPPIASGAVEGSARHLVQVRMKKPGARWSHRAALAVTHVRCRLLSDLPLSC
jgi:hypothetical protein